MLSCFSFRRGPRAGAVVVLFVGRVSDFLDEGEGGGRGLIFTELLLLTVPIVELLL